MRAEIVERRGVERVSGETIDDFFFFQSLMLNLPSEPLGNLVRFEMFFFLSSEHQDVQYNARMKMCA